ncbi:hypothetical protein PRCB_00195 [Pantoea rodasii]|uniref:DNA-binding protein n=1 Tax=Pantoea rodasii TaxID=1076549 RepID=A0A2M9WJ78_9GAMM|nr:hypothetical protein [Pantoea rodasii]PJZ07557.1 hypothetical protein PRCB_00195 [Pantoea rodasii]
MPGSLMTLPEMARYIGVPPATLACAICNRGTIEKVPLPAAVDDDAPLSCRCWVQQDVRQLRHAMLRARRQR